MGLSFSSIPPPSPSPEGSGQIMPINENESEIEEGKENEKEKKEKSEEQPGEPKKEKQHFTKTFIKKVCKNRRLIFLSLINVFSAPITHFFMSQWRNIAVINHVPTSYQQNIEAITPFVNCLGQLVFGWISDSISFRYLNSIISFTITFISIIYCFTFKTPFLFSICVLVYNLADGGEVTIGMPHLMKVFGLKHFIQISTVIRLPSTILDPLNYVFMYVFDNKLKNKNPNDLFSNYFVLYLILGIVNSISGVLSCFEPETEFKAD
jgi:MFS family permease